eukprot:621786-Amphidinium_carterae.1
MMGGTSRLSLPPSQVGRPPKRPRCLCPEEGAWEAVAAYPVEAWCAHSKASTKGVTLGVRR